MRTSVRRVSALLTALALAVSASLAGGVAAHAADSLVVTSVSRTGLNVPGYCSQAGGLVTDVYSPVTTLRLTVSPSSPRAGSKVTVKVFVKQPQRTPKGQAYPARLLRGEVTIAVSGRTRYLTGPVNARRISGAIFPNGWTAKATFKAPAKGKHRVTITRIVYNVRGGGNGGWGRPYAGFDLVCSGAVHPTTAPKPYIRPQLVIKVSAAA